MSIETLLEAAKFVEWSDKRGVVARGQNDQDVPIFGPPDLGRVPDEPVSATSVVSSSPSSSPGSHKSFSPATSYSGHVQSTSNTDTFDEADEKRSGTREVHNKLEKNRRAHLKECFDNLRDTIPHMDDKKMKPSNLSILQGALRYLQALKRKDRELEYETERLARQKIQYQEKLAKLSGCALPPWKKDEPADVEGAVTGDNDEDNEDDRESVSTSTSTASEAEEEERKSRAHSPDVKMPQLHQAAENHGPPILTSDPLADHVIKVTQSVKEQSGPFVISRRIVTHVPVPPGSVGGPSGEPVGMVHPGKLLESGTGGARPAMPELAPQGALAGGQRLPWVASGAARWPVEVGKPATVVTQRVAATQKVVMRPQSPLMGGVQLSPPPPASQTPARPVKSGQPPLAAVQPARPPSHVVRQFDSHSSAVSAVQEHLKNRAQSKLPQQQQQLQQQQLQQQQLQQQQLQQQQLQQQSKPPVMSTTPPLAPLSETYVSPKGNVTVANASIATTAAAGAAIAAAASAASTSSSSSTAGASRQTVSQLLGKQPVVIRQPVRRTDNKYVMQRVVRHPFSPRPQAVDTLPKSPTAGSAGGHPAPATIAMVTYKEPAVCSASMTTTATTIEGTGKLARPPLPPQPSSPAAGQPTATTLAGLDMRTVISHGVVLPSVPHYLPAAGLTAGMLRPSLASTSTNAALFSQGLLTGVPPRSITPHFSVSSSKESSNTSSSSSNKQVPASGPVSFLAPAASQPGQPGKVSQAKAPSLAYSGPLAPVHPFLSPGLTLQPALTQVLFTQPPMAAYTVANSPMGPRPLAKSVAVQQPQMVVRPSTVAGDVAQGSAAGMTATATTVATTMSPVVTIGAISFNPLLPANRALVTAPTYTTLSYRFPFAGQMPFISPVPLAGNPASVAGGPVTSAGHHPAAANGDTSNGMIVHTVAVPTVMPVTSAWLASTTTTISNGIPVKELPHSASTTPSTPSGTTTVASQATTGPAVSGPQEGAVPDMKSPLGSVVSAETSS